MPLISGMTQLQPLLRNQQPSLFSGSSWIWSRPLPSGRNLFVSFLKEIECGGGEDPVLHLFADTRFRVFVNESFVAYGPARFVTQFPEFDTFALGPYLRAGKNYLRVEVNFYGASSFQSMPDGRPGFIASGGSADGRIDLSTPGDWKARVHKAWDAEAPLFSFAQNPAEICDTRVLSFELDPLSFGEVALLEDEAIPWGELRPRSVPYPAYEPLRPVVINVAGPLTDGTTLIALQSFDREIPANKNKERFYQRLSSWIYSPKEHDCKLDCLWVDLELNGRTIARENKSPFGNHETAILPLKEGWNFFAARFQVLTEYWTALFGFPKEEEISWHALPDRSVKKPLLASPQEEKEQALPPAVDPADFQIPDGWELRDGDPATATPARQMAWDEFKEEKVVRGLPVERLSETSTLAGEAVSWCFDFKDEYYGHPVLEVEAPAGTILDIAYDDWQRQDGATNLYSSNPFTDAADRFYLRGGRQRIEVCNPRGGIFLQVTMRSPNGRVQFTLCDLEVLSRRCLEGEEDAFECPHPVFTWAWQHSLHTLVAATDEGYADCPWRERGSYIGDGYVNLHLHALLTPDFRIARRVLQVFGEAQLSNGQLPPVAPAWHRRPHEDFTLIWLLSLRDYWALSGDASLLAEMWPRIERLWRSPVWEAGPEGLWNAHAGTAIFLDWGKLPCEVKGEANAVLNLFRLQAARMTAEMAGVLGREADRERFTKEATAVQTGLEAVLWDEAEGRFRASANAETPAVHANTLALRFGVGDPARLLQYLEPLLRRNLSHGIERGQHTGFLELYFFHYLLPALARNGRHDLAETMIREHYGFLQDLGYPTLNECFSRAHRNMGSCCHSWSGGAAIYLARYTMGFRQEEAGNRQDWVLDPVSPSLDSAQCRFLHEDGPIAIEWEKAADGIRAKVSAPSTVRIRPAEGVALAQR